MCEVGERMCVQCSQRGGGRAEEEEVEEEGRDRFILKGTQLWHICLGSLRFVLNYLSTRAYLES